jgi:ankyrin repeat protein
VDEWRAFKLLPVTIAIINDNIPMLDALIYSHHVNLNPIDALLDVTPLQLAVAFAGVKPEAITRLLNNKTSPNLSNSLRQTPLHYLFLQEIYKEQDAAVINLKYYIAATYTRKSLPGSSETVFNIADNLEVKDDQVTFVKLAPPRREILDLLLQAGADPTLTDSFGQTVLHLAAFNPDINIIQLLLEKGCDPFQPTKKGWTPLHIACAMNHITVANLFLDRDPQTLVGLALLKKIVKANNNPLLLKKIEKIKPAKSWLPLFHAAKQADQKHEPLDEKKKNLPS